MVLLSSLRPTLSLWEGLRFLIFFFLTEARSKLLASPYALAGCWHSAAGPGIFLVEDVHNSGRETVVRTMKVSLPQSSGLVDVRFQIGTRPVPFIFFCLCDFAKGCGFVAMGDGNLGSSVFLETNLLEKELESKPECVCPKFDVRPRCFIEVPFTLLPGLDHFAS